MLARYMRVTSPSRGFVLLYAAAYAGLFVSFIPFASVLLPLKVAAVAAPDGRVWLLSAAALGGAGVASIANLAFGMLSDRSYRMRGTRRPWIAGGALLLLVGYWLFHRSGSAASLLAAVAVLQVAINMMFAPVNAIMADEVPDDRKGSVAGLMGAAHPFASLVAVGATMPGLGDWATRVTLLCLVTVALILPLLLLMRERRDVPPAPLPRAIRSVRRADFARLWTARVLVQVAGNGLSTYGLFYFLSLPDGQLTGGGNPEVGGAQVATIFAGVTVAALLATLAAGRASDQVMRRKPFLVGAAGLMAAGLGIMALANDWVFATLGYAAAMIGMAVFLAAHSALTMQLLPSPQHRGRDIGLLNLTNTLPAMVAPLLVLVLDPARAGYAPWLAVLAAGVLLGGLSGLSVRGER